jgi:hypothetical protein
MGMTLTLDDLKTALLMPKELALGFLLQYTVSSQSHRCSLLAPVFQLVLYIYCSLCSKLN